VPKLPGDDIGARETWIQERLGERKYRQLQMHLAGALRLLNELGADGTHSTQAASADSQPVAEPTTKAVADLTQRLQELSPKRPLRVRNLKSLKSGRREAGKAR
jgi:hypothetical protein